MLTQSDLERERYEARLKFQRDEYARLRYAREQGEERGVLIGRVQLCEELLKQGETAPDTLSSMTLEQLGELADRLKQQLASHG